MSLKSALLLLMLPVMAQAQPQKQTASVPVNQAPPANSQAAPVTRQAQAQQVQPNQQRVQQPAAGAPMNTAQKPADNAAKIPDANLPVPHADSPVDALLNEDMIRSLRDPFQIPAIMMARKETPKTDLELFQIKDFKLSGVVTGPKKTRAMLTTPSGKVFFVKVGDAIGTREGKITQIKTDAIKIREYFTNEEGKRTPDDYEINLSGDLVPLSRKEDTL